MFLTYSKCFNERNIKQLNFSCTSIKSDPSFMFTYYSDFYFLGLALFDGMKCDWSGEPGPAPTLDELCHAHVGKNAKQRLQCEEKNQVLCIFSTFKSLHILLLAVVHNIKTFGHVMKNNFQIREREI
jgi:hypothetical protein